MLLGYARVSTADQNPDHSGAKSSLPQLDLVLRRVRDGVILVITRLDRLGCSVLDLVTLGA